MGSRSRRRRRSNTNSPQPRAPIPLSCRHDFDAHLVRSPFVSTRAVCRLVLFAPGLLGLPERGERYVLGTVNPSVAAMDKVGAAVGWEAGRRGVESCLPFKTAAAEETEGQNANQQETNDCAGKCAGDDP